MIGGVVPPTGGGGSYGNRRTPEPDAMQSFADLNNSYNTMVSMIQVGLYMAPTPAQIPTSEKDCTDYNRTLAAWKTAQQQIKDFKATLVKQPAAAQGPTDQTGRGVMQIQSQTRQKGPQVISLSLELGLKNPTDQTHRICSPF